MRVVADADSNHKNVLRALYFVLCSCYEPLSLYEKQTKYKVQSTKFRNQLPRTWRKASAINKSRCVVILIFLELPSTIITDSPSCSTSQLSSVTAGSCKSARS